MVKGPSSPPAALLAALLLLALTATLFFYRVDELPLPHGDERSFLAVPFRFANFGDLRYPVFMSESFGRDPEMIKEYGIRLKEIQRRQREIVVTLDNLQAEKSRITK